MCYINYNEHYTNNTTIINNSKYLTLNLLENNEGSFNNDTSTLLKGIPFGLVIRRGEWGQLITAYVRAKSNLLRPLKEKIQFNSEKGPISHF